MITIIIIQDLIMTCLQYLLMIISLSSFASRGLITCSNSVLEKHNSDNKLIKFCLKRINHMW